MQKTTLLAFTTLGFVLVAGCEGPVRSDATGSGSSPGDHGGGGSGEGVTGGDTRPSPPRAFPGAEGNGTATPGGRGGTICRVTHLANAGAGSLRYCATELSGPRIVIFDTGGTIELQSRLEMNGDDDSYVTIAGQSAPGGGIQLMNYGFLIRNGAHDIVLRHLRIRPSSADPANDGLGDIDPVQLDGTPSAVTHDIVIDHCSLQWTPDENASSYDYVREVTWQWNIISEGEVDHPMGFLIGANQDLGFSTAQTAHHNLLAHNAERNPRLHKPSSFVHWVNNLVYNWGRFGRATLTEGASANFINNHYIKGPDSPTSDTIIDSDVSSSYGPVQIYASGNWGPACPSGCTDGDQSAHFARPHVMVSTPLPAPSITIDPTAQVYAAVLAGAGANRCAIATACRDSVDVRIVAEVDGRSGSVGSSPPESYPNLASGSAWIDRDGDGMPDSFEQQYGLNPVSSADGGATDLDGDGYSNVEEWLNDTDPGQVD